MTWPGPWIQPGNVEGVTSFLARSIRAQANPSPGVPESYFPHLTAEYSYPMWDVSMPRQTEWMLGVPEYSPWSYDASFLLKPFLTYPDYREEWWAVQAAPVLGSFALFDEQYMVPDPAPDGVIGHERENNYPTLLTRTARIGIRCQGDAPFTARVRTASPPDLTIDGPHREGSGHEDWWYGAPGTGWTTTSDVQASQQVFWPSVVHESDGNSVATLEIGMDITAEWVAFVPSFDWFDDSITPSIPSGWAANVPIRLVELPTISVLTTYRPSRYRWIYDHPLAGGMYNLRQRQSAGASNGWPLRQRQNGGHSGAWPLRQRQRGV